MSTHADFIASDGFRTGSRAGDRSVCLQFAGDAYHFVGLSDPQFDVVLERFGDIACPAPAESDLAATIAVDAAPAASFIDKETRGYDYRIALSHEAQTLHASGLHFGADIDRATLNATLYTSYEDDRFVGPFENVFRIIAAYRLFERGAFVMHSAAFARGPLGYLCFGRSGAGKTTLCELASSAGCRIISDELNAILPGRDGECPMLVPLPFAGDFGRIGTDATPAPLAGLFALAQGPTTTRAPLKQTRAVSRFIASCPYLNTDPFMHDALFERALAFVARYPVDVLTFTKTTDFLSILDDAKHPRPVLHA